MAQRKAKASSTSVAEARDLPMDSSGGWPLPVFDQGMTFRDIGSSGLRQYGGWVREEFLPQLVGRQAARVFREMADNSSVVGALVFAVTQAMRKIEWRTEAASDAPKAKAEAEFADSLRFDMSHTWEEFVAEALSMLVYGFSAHEIVYKRRDGSSSTDPLKPGSRFRDGRIGIRKLPIRGQDTVLKWFFGPNGEILGLTQQPWVGPLIDLPIEKLLLFRPTLHKGNPEGRSILRNAYRAWYFSKRLEEQEAIFLERMSGVPVAYVPNAVLEAASSGDSAAVAALEAYKRLVTNVRIDEQMGLVLPSDTWQGANGPSGAKMYDFQLVTPSGGRGQFNQPIERYKLDMLMSCLADFIQMGHEQRGTQGLALSKVDMFFLAIQGWLDAVATVLNHYLLPRVWKLNGLDPALMPRYVPETPKRADLAGLGSYLQDLAKIGLKFFPDEDLERFLRDQAGLPVKEGAAA